MTTARRQTFSMVTNRLHMSRAEKNKSVVRGLSVQLCSVNQRTTEAEEVTDS
jgi:hypothetical protein